MRRARSRKEWEEIAYDILHEAVYRLENWCERYYGGDPLECYYAHEDMEPSEIFVMYGRAKEEDIEEMPESIYEKIAREMREFIREKIEAWEEEMRRLARELEEMEE
ncbi:MAG: hypothetical protein QW324_07425 [Thermofilaceae archaeon]